MEFAKEVVASAVVSDIVGRIISCVIDNLLSSRGRARDEHRQRLELLLLDISSKVEEAEGRHITNLALLAQLKAVTAAMYRGRFALEFADLEDDGAAAAEEEAATGKRKLALCSHAVKRARLILGGGGGSATTEKRLPAVVEELEDLMRRDYMRSFIEMVMGYPRRNNNVPRAVTTTLFMDRCVFGRHDETERIVAFLLQPAPTSTGLSALAVVGDYGVGKTTLVKHVCHDDRVRGHFARVEWFSLKDVMEAGLQPGQNCFTSVRYLTGMRRILDEPRFRAVGRSLLVFHDAMPIDASAWAALLATSKLAEGSKFIFISHNAAFARIIGMVEPVVLRPLPEEEYWYYFKAFAFGGADPQDHPRIAAVGREISRNIRSNFLGARVLGDLLRQANFDARFWRMVLAAVVKQKHNNAYLAYLHVLSNLLSIKGWNMLYTPDIGIPPKTKLTLPDMLRAAATSSGSGLGGGDAELTLPDMLRAAATSSGSGLGGGDAEEAFTVSSGRQLYEDYSFAIVFKRGLVDHDT